jgi:3-dehydroquinate synthase
MLTFILQIKKWFIEIDEFDKVERKLLNFGHTFGHALEVGSSHTIGHGLAVAFGMRAALNFEMQSRALSTSEIQLSHYMSSLLTQLNVRWQENPIDWEKFKIAFDSDKKHKSSEYNLILPNFGGSVRIQAISKSVSNLQRVVEAQKQALTLGVL